MTKSITILTILTAIPLVSLALVALNNATSTEPLLPLAIVSAAGLVAIGLSQRAPRD